MKNLPIPRRKDNDIAYRTENGIMFWGKVEDVLSKHLKLLYKRKIQLLLTSPPFPLNRKKSYGNLTGQEYLKWLSNLAPVFRELLTEDGSLVIELGNAWEKGQPVMSTLPLRALLEFLDSGGFYLCQQFIYYNNARLPTPAQWVNVERIRVKDSFTYVWWMSSNEKPKANNRNVLKDYSSAMINLLKKQKYNSGKRPSEHGIGEKSFLVNNNGAIPSNVITFANTSASDSYQKYCRLHNLKTHPARMASGLAEFFIKFLTDPEDIVFDPFAGSNTTGAIAETLNRKWISVEPLAEYINGSKGRFEKIKYERMVGELT